MSEKEKNGCTGDCSSCSEDCSSSCSGDCSSCSSSCSSAKDMILPMNEKSNIKKIIGIVSGKGGVGKSLVSSLLACALAKNGSNVGILDADITGPSIPHAFGIKEKASSDGTYVYPATSKKLDIDIISANMLLENDEDPVLWRGSLISNLVSQFYKDVRWDEKEFLLIDMPPGTGDVALTTFQSIPLDGIIIVTTPQDLVSMIVKKAFNMAKLMNIPVLGIVENMSYIKCPDCNKKVYLYGEHKNDKTYEELGIEKVAELPIDPNLTTLIDEGRVEDYETDLMDRIVEILNSIEVKEKKRA